MSYADMFQEMGLLHRCQYTVKLQETATPQAVTSLRRIPYPLTVR